MLEMEEEKKLEKRLAIVPQLEFPIEKTSASVLKNRFDLLVHGPAIVAFVSETVYYAPENDLVRRVITLHYSSV